MRAAVRQAEDGGVVRQHAAHDLQVVHVVAGDREEDQVRRVGGDVVVGDLVRRAALALGDGGDALGCRRLVVRRIAQLEHAVPAADDVLAELRKAAQQFLGRRVGQDLGAHRGIAQALHALGDRQGQQLLVAGADGEGVQRRVGAEQHAHRPARHLRRDIGALLAGIAHAIHQAAPALVVGGAVGQQEPDRAAGLLAELGHPLQLALLDVEVAVHAEGAVAHLRPARGRCPSAPPPRRSGWAPCRPSASCGCWCGWW